MKYVWGAIGVIIFSLGLTILFVYTNTGVQTFMDASVCIVENIYPDNTFEGKPLEVFMGFFMVAGIAFAGLVSGK